MTSIPPRPTLSLTVGIVGHRCNKLPPDIAAIEDRLASVFRAVDATCADIRSVHPELYADIPHEIRLMSGYAEGADQLAVLATPSHWRIAAVLPFPRARYREDFAPAQSGDGQDRRGTFDELLTRADTVTELPGTPAVPQRVAMDDGAFAYAAVGAFLLRQVDVLVAIWDGAPSAGAGGTAEIVDSAVEADIPVVWIASTDDAPPRLLARGVQGPRMDGAEDATFGPLAEAIRRRLELVARQTSEEGGEEEHAVPARERLASFYADRLRPVCRWVVYDWVTCGLRPWKWRLRLDAEAPGTGSNDWTRFLDEVPKGSGALERIGSVLQPRFEIANNLATHFSHVYRSAYILTYFLSLIAVVIALVSLLPAGDHVPTDDALWHKAKLVSLELLIVVVIILIVRLGRRRRWHDRWVDYRALAEMLRHLRFLCLLGESGGTQSAQASLDSPGTEWVVWYVRATARELGVPGATLDHAYQRTALLATWRTEIAEQIAYNTRNAHDLSHLHHRLHRWGERCFLTTAGILIAFLLAYGVEALAPECPTCRSVAGTLFRQGGGLSLADALYSLKPFVSFLAALLPALGAAIASINFTGDFEGFARRSAQTAQGLAQLGPDYRRAEERGDLDASSEVLLATAQIMTEDVSFWQSLYSRKRLTLPG